MVVVDSSALIPLIRIGRLDLLKKVFDDIIVPEPVWEEIVVEGRKLGRALGRLEEGRGKWFMVIAPKKESLETGGLDKNDFSVFRMARDNSDILLTNDAALYYYALSQNVQAYWLTTIVLAAVKRKKISKPEAEDILLELVNTAGMHLKSGILGELLRVIRAL